MIHTKLPWRISDQKVYVADIDKARNTFNWIPSIDSKVGVRKMVEWVKSI